MPRLCPCGQCQMLNLGISYPLVLVLLPLVLLPWWRGPLAANDHPAVIAIPADRLSRVIYLTLATAGSLAILATVLGIADLHRVEHSVPRVGSGAHLVLLLDRSSSMDNTFAGGQAEDNEESKAAAARRLLSEFVQRREHDLFGVAAFSTTPLYVLPLTDRREATEAAIDTLATPGLAYTNVGDGLKMALSYYRDLPMTGSRAIVLVSDGAATVDFRTQEKLRQYFSELGARLYWIFLRTSGDRGPFDEPENEREDTAQAMPERYLHKFFQTLDVPYSAYEADDPQALEQAIEQIDRLENEPLIIQEKEPRDNLARYCYALALIALLLLISAKLLEVRAWQA